MKGFTKTAGIARTIEMAARKYIPGHAEGTASDMIKKHRGIRLMNSTKGLGYSHSPAERIARFKTKHAS